MEVLHTLFYFIVAIGILVAIHEFGHFWVARKVGVKVLRFSIGFGKVIWRYQKTVDTTEYALSAVPLGGYVKMVDEREGEVKPEDLPFAFNRQPLLARTAIVAAGPVFNLLLAIGLYWAVFMIGETGMRPIIGEIKPNTLAAATGFNTGEEIISVNDKPTPIWTVAIGTIFSAALDNPSAIQVKVKTTDDISQVRTLSIPEEVVQKPDLLYERLGLIPWMPKIKPVIGKILPDSAAVTAGLKTGDVIVQADSVQIGDWMQFVDYVQKRPGIGIKLTVDRKGILVLLLITPIASENDKQTVGKIGAGVEIPEALLDSLRVKYSLSVGDAFIAALERTYDYSVSSLTMMGKMLAGKASVQNLSGPISIAQYAGQSAEMGLVHFLNFMALVSVSLGVLNLLPVPVLDGGHLMFYALEAIKGRPLSDKVQMVFQQLGIMLLVSLMVLAVFLDLGRLFE